MIIVGAPLRHDARLFNTAVVIHRGRVLGVVPKIHLPTYREFYERRQFASGDGIVGLEITIAGQRVPVRHRPAVRGQRRPRAADRGRDLRGHVRAGAAVQPAGAGRCDGAGQPLRQPDHHRPSRHPQRAVSDAVDALSGRLPVRRRRPGGVDHRPVLGRSDQHLRERRELAHGARFEEDPQLTIADVDLDLLRQERARQGTFEDNRRAVARGAEFRTVEFALAPPDGDLGLRRTVERFPVRARPIPHAWPRTATRPTTSRSTAWRSGCGPSAPSKVVIGVSGGLDSTHALIVAARAMDLLGLPADQHPRLHDARVRHRRRHQEQRLAADDLARHHARTSSTSGRRRRRCSKDLDHPFGRGEEVYDVTFENVQAGLRTDYLFRLANHQNAIVLGTGDLSELALGWCTYGVGDQMSHYNVNGGVPKTLIQHLIRWVSGLEVFAGETRRGAAGDLEHRDLARADPGEARRGAAEHGEVGRPVRAAGLQPLLHAAFRVRTVQDRVPGPPRLARRRRRGWPPAFPPERRRAYDIAVIRQWLVVFVKRFFGFAQFKRSAMPNGPKVSHGGSLSPRGDWRAPSDGNAAVWLADIEKNVPTQ